MYSRNTGGKLVTERIPQVNELLHQELGSILLREFDVPEGTIVTITRVDASPNLQQAKIYISVMPEEKAKEVLRLLKKEVYEMQQLLNKRLNMRPVPRIEWVVETKTQEAQEIEEILDRIKEEK
ncbi:30S ribosome-binding factor RbfA [Patescibacteria group bacterium]|nr:30S ribosome-binding factor RbfA [Patescibacteria group bacterium]